MAKLRSIFLTSTDPERTSRFYETVAGLPMERVGEDGDYRYWKCDQDGLQFAIHGAEEFAAYTSPPEPRSNLTHLYFQIDDQEAFLKMLDQAGVSPTAVEDVNIIVEDPDGRKVLFGAA